MSRDNVLNAYADDAVAADRRIADLIDAIRARDRAFDIALLESTDKQTVVFDDRDAWRETQSVTLSLLSEALRTIDRLTEQLREARAQKR